VMLAASLLLQLPDGAYLWRNFGFFLPCKGGLCVSEDITLPPRFKSHTGRFSGEFAVGDWYPDSNAVSKQKVNATILD